MALCENAIKKRFPMKGGLTGGGRGKGEEVERIEDGGQRGRATLYGGVFISREI